MGKIILGFIAGYILSDIITSKFPQVGQYKIQPQPQQITQIPALPNIKQTFSKWLEEL